MSFSIVLDPEKTLKSGINFAVMPIVLTYKDNTKNETFFEPLVPVSVEFTVPSKSCYFYFKDTHRYIYLKDINILKIYIYIYITGIYIKGIYIKGIYIKGIYIKDIYIFNIYMYIFYINYRRFLAL